MQIHVPQIDDPVTQVLVSTAEGVIAKHSAMSPCPSPCEIELPAGVNEDDVEIAVVGLDNRGIPTSNPIVTKQRSVKPVDPPVNDPPVNDPPVNDPAEQMIAVDPANQEGSFSAEIVLPEPPVKSKRGK